MSEHLELNVEDYIRPLNMNGLEGRTLHMPAPAGKKSVKILYVYGHHSSLERWWGLAQILNEYGELTMPDLPGFGGMDSFYKIGKQPTIDNFADYLAAFIKLRYKREKCTILGLSFGFIIATRMLQRYPDMAKNVHIIASVAGFSHRDDFIIPKRLYNFYRIGAWALSHRIPAAIFYQVALNAPVLGFIYKLGDNHKMKGANPDQFKRLLAMEVQLWRINDVRTAMRTTSQFLVIDNCKVHIDLPVYHVGMKGDQYFDNHMVEQHLRVIFSDYYLMDLVDVEHHAPSVIATKQETMPFVPPKLREALSKL